MFFASTYKRLRVSHSMWNFGLKLSKFMHRLWENLRPTAFICMHNVLPIILPCPPHTPSSPFLPYTCPLHLFAVEFPMTLMCLPVLLEWCSHDSLIKVQTLKKSLLKALSSSRFSSQWQMVRTCHCGRILRTCQVMIMWICHTQRKMFFWSAEVKVMVKVISLMTTGW